MQVICPLNNHNFDRFNYDDAAINDAWNTEVFAVLIVFNYIHYPDISRTCVVNRDDASLELPVWQWIVKCD